MTPKNPSHNLTIPTPIAMNERQVFEQMFRVYHKALCSYARGMVGELAVAEDLVSEVFIRYWNDQRTFENEDHARFSLYRAVRHAAINELKATQRLAKKHEQAGSVYDAAEVSHQEHYIRAEALRGIYNQIEKLPPQERTVLLLTLRDGKKLQEVADELGLSVQTVKNCKGRALRRLRTRLSIEDFAVLLFLLSFPFD